MRLWPQEDRRGKVTALRRTALRTGPLTLSLLTQPVLEALAGVNSRTPGGPGPVQFEFQLVSDSRDAAWSIKRANEKAQKVD